MNVDVIPAEHEPLSFDEANQTALTDELILWLCEQSWLPEIKNGNGQLVV
ncbi:hypothetical protein JW962_02995 [Candidatus Dojkabacteria bacterium]|nr:hypothetical protein [Candidatus Dojkabacteria bacterium]